MIGKMTVKVVGGPCTKECPMPPDGNPAAWIHPDAKPFMALWVCPNCYRVWDEEPRRVAATLPISLRNGADVYDPVAEAELKAATEGMTPEQRADYMLGPERAIVRHDFIDPEDWSSSFLSNGRLRPGGPVFAYAVLECGHRRVVTIARSGPACGRTVRRCRECSPRPYRISDILR